MINPINVELHCFLAFHTLFQLPKKRFHFHHVTQMPEMYYMFQTARYTGQAHGEILKELSWFRGKQQTGQQVQRKHQCHMEMLKHHININCTWSGAKECRSQQLRAEPWRKIGESTVHDDHFVQTRTIQHLVSRGFYGQWDERHLSAPIKFSLVRLMVL